MNNYKKSFDKNIPIMDAVILNPVKDLKTQDSSLKLTAKTPVQAE